VDAVNGMFVVCCWGVPPRAGVTIYIGIAEILKFPHCNLITVEADRKQQVE